MRLPKCSSCGKDIPPTQTTIEEDIRHRGLLVISSEAKLNETLYKGTICRSCGRMYCLSCHDFTKKGYSCPTCDSALSPLFADYLDS